MADVSLDVQDKVVFFLGYPSKVLVEDSTHYNRIIKNRFLDLSQSTVTRVTELVALVDETRTQLDNTRTDGNVTSVGEINLDPNFVDTFTFKQYRRYIKELSSLLDVPIRKMNAGGGVSVKW